MTLCWAFSMPSTYSFKGHDNSMMKAPLLSFTDDKTGIERLRDLLKAPSSKWQGEVSACTPAAAWLPLGFH